MKKFSLVVIMIILATFVHSAYSQTGKCEGCGEEKASGARRTTNYTTEELVKAFRGYNKDEQPTPTFEEYMYSYCEEIKVTNLNEIYAKLNEFRDTKLKFNDFLTSPKCQPQHYGSVIKAPMLHLYLDDPCERVKHLRAVADYVTEKRKDPGSFTEMLNAKNTKGETLLDYIEVVLFKKKFTDPGELACISRMTQFICSRGGKYEKYQDKKCS